MIPIRDQSTTGGAKAAQGEAEAAARAGSGIAGGLISATLAGVIVGAAYLAGSQVTKSASAEYRITTPEGRGVHCSPSDRPVSKEEYDKAILTQQKRLSQPLSVGGREIALRTRGGTLIVPVQMNNTITLDFILDSGAADVSVPADVFSMLVRTGTITPTDYGAKRTYVLADGSKVPAQSFRINSLKVGDVLLQNVTGSISPSKGPLLLGQSFLSRFTSWSIDNSRGVLTLGAAR